ncbi:MAG: L-serine ammonia-lyase, iron-sulfur-dependent subunit beta [Oscillospiraceae bacterium]|nr:L-serine ammonia-lyase, iron-sulfur-dependent subunit beta [Oscillospiraceae bacterium]
MDLFDIIGPIMIGPSSSHTAGAARIGRVTRRLLGAAPVRAQIGFHGSFATTWRGHGTDRAVIGGLLDMDVDDARLRDSLAIAEAEGLSYTFETIHLRDAHPNTMTLSVTAADGRTLEVQAASIGGGRIRIQAVDGLEVRFTGEDDTLIIRHRDMPGAIAQVSSQLALSGVNIATMRVFRKEEGGSAIMALEIDALPDADTVDSLKHLRGMKSVTLLEKR